MDAALDVRDMMGAAAFLGLVITAALSLPLSLASLNKPLDGVRAVEGGGLVDFALVLKRETAQFDQLVYEGGKPLDR